ncbi:MAG: topoisomerase [Clostridiales bacterium 43-6]|nr:MAG: topoisomerase [Clostridiales bacterium 43-6]
MPYVEPDAIIRAKQVDLLSYMKSCEPDNLVHIKGDNYCTKEHDSLKISNGKWCWWSRGIGGKSALDYLIKVKGYSFTDAVEQIIGQTIIKPSAHFPAPKQEKKLLLPDLCAYPKNAKDYLLSRGIDEEIIDYCIKNGSIREDDRYHNVLFMGFDKSEKARYCAIRSTVGNFKIDATGSDKHYSFKLFSREPKNTLHLFESAIDLLSYATLLKRKKNDWRSENLLSLAGVYQPQKDIKQSKVPVALNQYLEDYPHIRTVIFHLDNDRAGQLASQAIRTVLPPEYETIDAPPPAGKDCNDYLLTRLGECNKIKERSDAR